MADDRVADTAAEADDARGTELTVPCVAPLGHAPHYASDSAAGADLRAAIDTPLLIDPGTYTLIPTGVALAIPDGYEGQVRPRSGLAVRHGVTVLNAPGTIDADYRGEVRVALVNLGNAPFSVEPGMRIAQLVIAPVVRATFRPVDTLDSSARGAGGFGSTGVR